MRRSDCCLFVLIVAGMLSPVAPAWAQDNWPQFRGADAMGSSTNANLPDHWSDTENVAWKIDIKGRGWSSPIVWGDKIFLTTCINQGETEEPKKGLYFGGERAKPPESQHDWKVMCLDLKSGGVLWERTAHTGVPATTIHIKNSYASETPVTDGQRVYAYFGNVGVFCSDLDGKPLWSKTIEPHKMRFGWGTAASPVVYEDRVYIVNDNDEDSYLLALDARTGEEQFRVPREGEKSNWSTPYIWKNSQRTELVTTGTKLNRSYDLEGRLLWELGGMSSIAIAKPYSKDDVLYISSGYVLDKVRPMYAVQPVAAVVRRSDLRSLRSGILRLLRPQYGRGGLQTTANTRRSGLHDVSLGLRRQDILLERRRRDLCHRDRPGVQDSVHQHAGRRRHGHGHAGPGGRPVAAAHFRPAVLHPKRRQTGRLIVDLTQEWMLPRCRTASILPSMRPS
jgi:hypothetical protein